MPYENLLRAVSLALEAEALARRVDDPALVVQMLVLKLAELPRLRGHRGGARRRARRRAAAGAGRPRAAAPDARAGPRIVSLVPVEPEPERAGRGAAAAAGRRSARALPRDPRLAPPRDGGAGRASPSRSSSTGDDLVLRFGIDRAAAKEALEEPAAKKLLAEVAREAFGRPHADRAQDRPAGRRRSRQGRPRGAPRDDRARAREHPGRGGPDGALGDGAVSRGADGDEGRRSRGAPRPSA